MSSPRLLSPLVGSHFHPPAKQVLQALVAGQPLLLVPDPSNPYDAKAVKVFVNLHGTFPVARIPELDEVLAGTGFTAVELLANPEPLMIGHLADSDGKVITKAREGAQGTGLALVGNREFAEWAASHCLEAPWPARLAFTPNGQPAVTDAYDVSEMEGE